MHVSCQESQKDWFFYKDAFDSVRPGTTFPWSLIFLPDSES